MPKPPALLTAAARRGLARREPTPACWMGTVRPTSSVRRVASIAYLLMAQRGTNGREHPGRWHSGAAPARSGAILQVDLTGAVRVAGPAPCWPPPTHGA